MSIVEQMEQELQKAQVELVQADVAAIEATTRLEAARSATDKLSAAVAAMNGKTPAEPPAPEVLPKPLAKLPEGDLSYEDRAIAADMTEEEFDAYRKKRQRARQKQLDADNPLAQYKCGGCGEAGTSSEQIITAPSGAPVRLIVCSACGNQTF